MGFVMGALLIIGAMIIAVIVAKLVSRIKIFEMLADLAILLILILAYLKNQLVADTFQTGGVTAVLEKVTDFAIADVNVVGILLVLAGAVVVGRIAAKTPGVRNVVDLLPF